MDGFWKRTAALIEAACNMLFALIVFAMSILLLAPLLNLLRGKQGILWIGVTIVVMGALYLVVSWGIGPALDLLDRIRRGESFGWALSPVRAMSSVIGIYGVFKLEYFLVHGYSPDAESVTGSWPELLWQFVTSL